MASYTTTAKYLLRRLTGGSNVQEVDDGIGALADDVDANMAGYAEGTLAARPSAAKSGRLYRTTDSGQVFMDTGSAWIEIGVSPWVPGDLMASWLTSARTGWLLCDGSAVSRSTYAALFSAISTSAGVGNGSTTFNVPDFRGRVFVMPDGSAGRMSANDARGNSGGAELTVLAGANLPVGLSYLATSGGSAGYSSGSGDPNPGQGDSFTNMQPYLVGGAVFVKT